LVWDRLPLTVAFMSILAATITERINVKLGVWLLVPLVIAVPPVSSTGSKSGTSGLMPLYSSIRFSWSPL
jgi:hypothetical protein